MKKTLLFLFIIISFHCGKQKIIELPITTKTEKAKNFYKKAIIEWESGGYVEKVAYFDSALVQDPDFVMALLYNDHPNQLLKKEREEKAHSLKEKVTKQEQLILDIVKNIDTGNLDDALMFSQKLTGENPQSYEAYNNLGYVYELRREFIKSKEAFEKAINLNSDNYFAYSQLWGQYFSEHGSLKMAPDQEKYVDGGLEYINELIRIRPESGQPYHSKANLYRKIGDFEKAKPFYEKSIQKRKGSSAEGTALTVSGHNYMFSGDFNTARKQYDLAVQQAPIKESKFILNNYITWSFIFQDDYTGAIQNINKTEKNLDILGFSGEALLQRKAQLSWQKFICYAHNQMEAKADSALNKNELYRKKRTAIFQDDIMNRNSKTTTLYMKAWRDVLFGRYNTAKNYLSELRQITEKINSPTAMYDYNNLLGMVTLMEGNAQESLEAFDKGDPDNTYFLYFKALALRASGDKTGAKKILTDIANTNFSYWQLALVRERARTMLEDL